MAMTEAEWLSCQDLRLMLKQLRRQPGDRKLRLFICACYRQIWDLLDPRYREALTVSEQFADRQVSAEALAVACATARTVRQLHGIYFAYAPEPTFADAATAANFLAHSFPHDLTGVERATLRALLFHIFRNPFRVFPRPPRIPPAVVQLAETLYAGTPCSFALHDALLDAGHAELAEHFREAEHPKGCWALDLLLGKQ